MLAGRLAPAFLRVQRTPPGDRRSLRRGRRPDGIGRPAVAGGRGQPTRANLEWEGTRYRVDFAQAEAIRMVRAFGGIPSSALSSADVVVRIADALDDPALAKATLAQHATTYARH